LTTAAGLGFFPVLEDADSLIQVDHTVIPKTGQFQRRYEELYAEYVELGSELQGHFKSLSKVI
jgi:hypothetical protein